MVAVFEAIKKLLHRNVKRFRGGLVFKAHRLLYHSTLGVRVIKKKEEDVARGVAAVVVRLNPCRLQKKGFIECAVVPRRARI